MAAKNKFSNPEPISDLASAILDPVLRRRAGISIGLVQSWDEIVGQGLAGQTRPEKVIWPRRASDDDPFEPATLVICCAGSTALRLQHQTGEVIDRVNAYLGFVAIGRIRIMQKAMIEPKAKPVPARALTPEEASRLGKITAEIEDSDLRASLERLGRSVLTEKR